MIVTHIDGRTELLTDYKSLQRKQRVNGEYSLSFLLFKTERNEHSFPLTVEESLVEYDGQQYRIKKMSEKTIGNTPVKQIQADHIFFDLVDEYQYETISGAKSLSVCLMHALDKTGYTITVVDLFPSVTFENFGDDNPLALIQIALNRFNAEIEINGKHLTFRKQIGRKTDIQFRYKHNIKTIEKFVDSSNLSTFIKGFGKQNEDGSYVVTAEYTSPLAEYYGIRHAKPVRDERYTTHDGLMERLVTDLQDVPDISLTLDVVELKKAGVITEQLVLGDEIFVIYEPLNIDIIARVVEIVDNPEEPLSSQLTLANFRGSFLDSIADFQRSKDRIDGLFDGAEKLPFSVLDEAVQKATLALQSAQTELEFKNGIIARDPRDSNRLMIITSTGIGISVDGGKTFKEAITADGFVLSAGAIGQLSANNIIVGDGTRFDNGYDPRDAKSAADKAKQDADIALGKLADIAADNKITPDEKLELKREWSVIQGERPTIVAQATTYSVSSAAYTSAYNTLSSYITPILSIMTSTTTVVRTTFDANFKNYYDEKIKLLKLVTDRSKEIADSAKLSADEAKGIVQVWQYPNTTLINGGSIMTNTIGVNKLTAGLLTGFTIQTDSNASNPRIVMEKDKLVISNAGHEIRINTSGTYGTPEMGFKRPGDAYDFARIGLDGDNLRIHQGGSGLGYGRLQLWGQEAIELERPTKMFRGAIYDSHYQIPSEAGMFIYDYDAKGMMLHCGADGWRKLAFA